MPLLITGANIATMDRDRPRATAAVVVGQYFAYVGDEAGARDYLARYPGGPVEQLDAGGRFMMPGFNDSHMHFLHYVKGKQSVNLVGTASLDELLQRMRDGLADGDDDQWLLGEGWNQDHFTSGEKRFPTADDLDKVSRRRPIVIYRACFHVGVFNTRAMELMQLDDEQIRAFGDMAGTRPDGTPNGVFTELALDPLKTRIPAPGLDALVQMMCEGQEDLFRLGITSVQSDERSYTPQGQFPEMLCALRKAAETGRLKLRMAEQALVTDMADLKELFDKGFDEPFGGHRFCVAGIKILTDGSLGARTALMNKPYHDDPSTRGLANYTQQELDELVLATHRHNRAAIIHAIGDGAIDMCLDAIEKARTAMPYLRPRHGIVHCQITTPEQIRRFAALDVVAYTQPIFLDSDMHIVRDRVGDLADTSYAWADYARLGVHQAFGTDCPVEPPHPLPGIYCAATRCDLKGRGPYLPQQAMPVEDCLYTYTAAGAWCTGEEDIKGMIRPGHLADFILLDRDLLAVPPQELLKAEVTATYVGGSCVWQA